MRLFLILFFLCANAFAVSLPDPSVAKYGNLQAIQYAFDISNSTVYRNATISASTDPFSGKTNKYAETAAIMVTCTGAAAHIAFGATAPTATTANFLIPQNVPTYFKIDNTKAFIALIQDAATAICYTVELK